MKELQAQQLEYDYYSLCVRHPVPFTRPKVAFYTNYPEAWVSYYQAKNFLAIDPVLNPENFSQGHLMWNDDLFSEAQPLWEAARAHGIADEDVFIDCLTLTVSAVSLSI